MDLRGVVVLIIGISNDIGEVLADILLKYHATVIGTFYKNKIKKDYETIKCNVTKEKEVQNLFSYVKSKYSHIDVVVNLVGLDISNDIKDKSYEEFMNVVSVNLGGTFNIAKYASIYMERGTLINMASTDGIDTFNPLSLDYAASKAGIINLTKNLALRLKNIKVCGLAPNWIDTKNTLSMDPEYLKAELERVEQTKLISKESVALKIMEIMINDDIVSGTICVMRDGNE